MADPVKGVLEVRTDPGDVTRITLNPDSADITAGGEGAGGDLILKSGSQEVIRLGRIVETSSEFDVPVPLAEYNGLRIRTSGGVEVVRIGRIRASVLGPGDVAPDEVSVIVGGPGFSGRVQLVDKNKKTRVTLGEDDGDEARIVVFSTTGKKIFEFNPASATLYLGAEGTGGDLVLRDWENRERIKLNSTQGDLTVLSSDGDQLLHFDSGYAALYIGGQGNEGDVIVRDAANKERIKLDAGEGDIWVRDAAGVKLLHFDSEYAALYVGGDGNEGDVIVRNGDGKQTIKLDGGQGDIILSNADCAEEFDTAEDAPAGSVMVIGDDERLVLARDPYDRRVAGVVSGAGSLRPGIVLDRREVGPARPAVALAGKVHCRVDASYGAISGGDLLVSSPTPGHAMVATDPNRWPGAVLGKALRPWREGPGLIPILVSLQ